MDILALIKKPLEVLEARIERRAQIRELRTRAWMLDEGSQIIFKGGQAHAADLRAQADALEENKKDGE